MANVRKIQLSFAGGELSPEMLGRVDNVKYQNGLARCRNFVVKAQGPLENRPGFKFVREVKDSTKRVRLISFTYSTSQTMVIEMGAGYFRFHTQGATLLGANGKPYEVANPYTEEDLFDVHYVQSADVLTLVHPNHPPRELRRLGAQVWDFRVIHFLPSLAPPASVWASSAGASANKYTYNYVVTALDAENMNESGASAVAAVGGNLLETGATVTVSWSGVTNAARYNVYKLQGGLYGYIGQTTSTSIVDDNIAPDMSMTPPLYDPVFQGFGIESIPVLAGGGGYARAYAGGNIVAVNVTKQMSSGEDKPITISVIDPTGYGASLEPILQESNGMHDRGKFRIIGIKVLAQGSNYSAPQFKFYSKRREIPAYSCPRVAASVTPIVELNTFIQISDPTGRGAQAVPVIENGAIKSILVISSGYGYTRPQITITSQSGGSGAVLGAPVLTTGDSPGAVSYFEQRRCFAGTRSKPQNMWMTRSGTESNMGYSLPTRDDDRIAFRVAAREANTIRHIVPLAKLLLLTGSAEWLVTSANSDAITPSTISVSPQSYVGASNVQPVIINNTLIYGAARGGHVREMAYSLQANGFVTGDLSLRAAHLFDGLEIVDMAYAKAPQPLVWMVSSNGRLLGLTYVPEEEVGAWHWHDTDGAFESCAVVAEGTEDALYCVVSREVNGAKVRYIERMASRAFSDQADAFFVDSGLTYDGGATGTVTGLQHLEGKTVNVLADGAVHPQCVVRNGEITLDRPASRVHVGLPIVADFQTLPFSAQLDAALGQGRMKNINQAWLRVYRSSGVFVGADEKSLVEAKQRSVEPYGAPPALKTEEIRLAVTPVWNDGASVLVRQLDPLPLTAVNMTLEVAIGA